MHATSRMLRPNLLAAATRARAPASARRSGGGGAGGSAKSALERDRHARFAAALALRDVLELGDATPGLAAAWARVAARGDVAVSPRGPIIGSHLPYKIGLADYWKVETRTNTRC